MLLKAYLKKNNIRSKAFAGLIGISSQYMYHLLKGRRRAGLDLAKKIEIQTGEQVTRMEILYPDEFTEEKVASDSAKTTAKQPKVRFWIVTEATYL